MQYETGLEMNIYIMRSGRDRIEGSGQGRNYGNWSGQGRSYGN